MVVFQCLQLAWQFQTLICFPAVKRNNSGIRSWKKALIGMSSMSESHSIIQRSEEMSLQAGFRIWQFKTPAWKQYLQKPLLVVRLDFWAVMVGIFWKRESRHLHVIFFFNQIIVSSLNKTLGAFTIRTRKECPHSIILLFIFFHRIESSWRWRSRSTHPGG